MTEIEGLYLIAMILTSQMVLTLCMVYYLDSTLKKILQKLEG